VISLAVAAAGWVGSVHPEITPPENFHHLRDTTLWKAADWDPNFLDVVATTLQETPPTRNRKIHGGDSYAP